MLTATATAFDFQTMKDSALKCVSENDGIKQSEVAKHLGIPSQFDHNWITKGLLDGLVDEGRLTKDSKKLFRIARK